MADFICMFQHIPVPEVSDGVGSSPDGRLYLFQHIPVPEVSDGVGSSPDGRLYLFQHIPVPEVSDGVGSSPDGRLYLFQHIPVPEVSDGVGSSPDGRLYPGIPIWVSLAVLAPGPQCLRLIQIPRTGKWRQVASDCNTTNTDKMLHTCIT